MRKLTYPAVLEPAEDGAYSVYFPDLPGCISYGKDFETALSEAQDALGLHIYGMEKDGEPVPAPLACLRSKQVRFTQSVEKDRMVDAVLSVLR